MPAPTIYYIRHGETQWNAEGKLQGQQDIPLNDLGRKQAANAGGILAGLFARDGRSETSLEFVASPLGRARSTMELVRSTLKLPPHDYAVDDGCARSAMVNGKARRSARCKRPIPMFSRRARAINGPCRRLMARATPRCRPG